jgi:thymidylate synthase (FAD)
VLQGAEAARVLEILKADAGRAYDHYEEMLSRTASRGWRGNWRG